MIERIIVEHFANKYNYDFELPEGLSFLTGPNGSGKTTILKTARDLMRGDMVDDDAFTRFVLFEDGKKHAVEFWGVSSTKGLNEETMVPGYFSYEEHDDLGKIIDHGEWFKNALGRHEFIKNNGYDPTIPLSRGEQRLESLYGFIETYKSLHPENGILLLDGIEEGIHVADIDEMRKNLEELVDEFGMQVIVATHSVSLIDGDWDNTIDLFENHENI